MPVSWNEYPLLVPAAKVVSIKHAPVELGGVQLVPESDPRVEANPTVGYAELYEIWAVFRVRSEATAEDSLAEMRARNRLGIAIAAIIRMMATTISSSIRENPFCLSIACKISLFRVEVDGTNQRLVAVNEPLAGLG